MFLLNARQQVINVMEEFGFLAWLAFGHEGRHSGGSQVEVEGVTSLNATSK
jgi:hypothetical protein